MAFVCLRCNQSFNVGYLRSIEGAFYCPNKNCGTMLEDVDDMMLPISKILYDKGFEVLDSCSGHISCNDVQEVVTYIKLSRYCRGLYIDDFYIKYLLKGIDNKSYLCYNDKEILIKISVSNVRYLNVMSTIVENCTVLLDWCLTSVEEFCSLLDSSWCEGEEESNDVDEKRELGV